MINVPSNIRFPRRRSWSSHRLISNVLSETRSAVTFEETFFFTVKSTRTQFEQLQFNSIVALRMMTFLIRLTSFEHHLTDGMLNLEIPNNRFPTQWSIHSLDLTEIDASLDDNPLQNSSDGCVHINKHMKTFWAKKERWAAWDAVQCPSHVVSFLTKICSSVVTKTLRGDKRAMGMILVGLTVKFFYQIQICPL